MSSRHPDRSSQEIRRDIERTRAHMDETVEELRDRLSPGQLVDELWTRFRRSGRDVGDVARDHAVPLALMGLGVAWLGVQEATGHSRHDHAPRYSTDPHRASFGDKAHSAKEKARDAKHWVGEKLDRAGEVGDDARDAATRAADAVRHAGEETRERLHSATDRASSLMHDSPLAMGAIAFGLGLASGLAVPTSHVEDRLMGERSSELKREARGRARELKEEAKHVAADAAEGARSGLESHASHGTTEPSTSFGMGDDGPARRSDRASEPL